MNAKTMEGIAGAGTNMNLLNTPMRVYKEARRKGNQAVMERAMGYASEFADKAHNYQTRAEEGMKEDAKESAEKEKEALEQGIQKRKAQREECEKRIKESAADKTENISGDSTGTNDVRTENTDKTDTEQINKTVTYSKTGAIKQGVPSAEFSLSI